MSQDEQTELVEFLGQLFRKQGIKLSVSIMAAIIAGTLAWANLQSRVSNLEIYDSPRFQAYMKDHEAADESRKLLLIRIADKLGVEWKDLK